MFIEPGKLLKDINSPEELRKLSKDQLPQFCDELRQYIIDTVSIHGGHFGANLGVVELTAALHYVFNTPDDKLVWDVGHQAYGHKILTERREAFYSNRVYGGLSGFPKISESKYDAFGVGHSSTSISAALGMAVGSKHNGDKEAQHIAVIGDGAMTAGLAFEGMNHAGSLKDANILIILNDNCMSIDPNVGALREYLTDITTSKSYNKVKSEVWNLLGKMSHFGKSARDIVSKIENALKGAVLGNSNIFEALNLRYFGPIDGHDIDHLVAVMEDLKNIPGPKILHCITKKGKGYEPAEKDQTKWHAPGLFDKLTGEIKQSSSPIPQPPKYQTVFGKTIVELAEANESIVGVTPAMPSGSSMNIMMEAMPDRAFDVGIAEQHAVTFSAGMATKGLTVFCNIYSTFMQRAYDQVIHDVCLQKLPVIFCLDRAGFAGADGPTHHGAYDIAFMRCIPNMIVSAPMNEEELRNLMFTAQSEKIQSGKEAFTIRYPRGKGVMVDWKQPMKLIEVGQARETKTGTDLALLTLGHVGNFALTAANELSDEGLSVAHYDMRFAKPLDEVMLHEVFQKFNKIVTVEDGCLQGGMGSAILEFMADHGYSSQVRRLGIPDRLVEHGEQSELHAECGFDKNGIKTTCLEMTSEKTMA
ncbi:MAG: 1-deoxy-D-xylulose-5-phosphate synthase [Psychromonas sp.]|jgi:1-deoxy-D-xylulose-5-phosphate synthase